MRSSILASHGEDRRAPEGGAVDLVSASIHLSIVSHLQAPLVSALLEDLAKVAAEQDCRISVLSNLPEAPPAIPPALAGKVEHLTNEKPAGFSANHNKVFHRCSSPFFCVLNPDLRLSTDPFPELLRAFMDKGVALVAPGATDVQGVLQDNARMLMTPWRVISKLWSAPSGPDYPDDRRMVYPDWVAGYFMLVRSSNFRKLGGFDERYFLYYEDIDLCCRVRLAGGKIAWLPGVRVVHDARRRSHRNPKFLFWHIRSLVRFFASPVYRAARSLQAISR
jgi:GT2 family glycosyltransferase